jgi:aerotaxis receptor
MMSREMSDWFATHVLGEESNFSTIRGSVNNSMFVECMARILSECNDQLATERRGLGDIDMDAERAALRKLADDNIKLAEEGLKTVETESDRILKACSVMHRHMLGLSSTRVMCKIESARLSQEGESLTDIIEQLGTFQQRISAQLDRIAKYSNGIQSLER